MQGVERLLAYGHNTTGMRIRSGRFMTVDYTCSAFSFDMREAKREF